MTRPGLEALQRKVTDLDWACRMHWCASCGRGVPCDKWKDLESQFNAARKALENHAQATLLERGDRL